MEAGWTVGAGCPPGVSWIMWSTSCCSGAGSPASCGAGSCSPRRYASSCAWSGIGSFRVSSESRSVAQQVRLTELSMRHLAADGAESSRKLR